MAVSSALTSNDFSIGSQLVDGKIYQLTVTWNMIVIRKEVDEFNVDPSDANSSKQSGVQSTLFKFIFQQDISVAQAHGLQFPQSLFGTITCAEI